MNFHYMSLFEDNSKESLISLSNTVHEVGYKSLLLVYDTYLDNAVVNVANTINMDHKFKYIIALRTYSVSPEYLAQMYETFEKIAPGRVTFNIIPGNIKIQETSLKDVVFIEDKIKTPSQRDEYTLEWLKKYNKLSMLKNLPPLMLSGSSIEFQKACIEYGFTNIIKMDHFLNQKNNGLLENKNQIVSVAILNTDVINEGNKHLNKILGTHDTTLLSGNSDDIIQKLLDLEKMGVSDIMIHKLPVEYRHADIHYIVKDFPKLDMNLSKEMIY